MPDTALAAIAIEIAQRYQPPATGHPSRIGEADTVQELLSHLELGHFRDTAAKACGIATKTLYNWLERGQTGEEPYNLFLRAVERAEARGEHRHLQNIANAGEHVQQWTASAWILERTRPDKYGRRNEDSSSPKVVVQIGVSADTVRLSPSVTVDSHRLTADNPEPEVR